MLQAYKGAPNFVDILAPSLSELAPSLSELGTNFQLHALGCTWSLDSLLFNNALYQLLTPLNSNLQTKGLL